METMFDSDPPPHDSARLALSLAVISIALIVLALVYRPLLQSLPDFRFWPPLRANYIKERQNQILNTQAARLPDNTRVNRQTISAENLLRQNLEAVRQAKPRQTITADQLEAVKQADSPFSP